MLPPSPRMKTFKPSGENAAAVALLMFSAVVDGRGRSDDVYLIGSGNRIGEDSAIAVVRDGQDLAGYHAQRGAGSAQGRKRVVAGAEVGREMARAPNSLPM